MNWAVNRLLGLLVAICLAAVGAQAQNATSLLNSGSGGFETATNWRPATVPGTAIFGASNTTTITFRRGTYVDALQFNADFRQDDRRLDRGSRHLPARLESAHHRP
jgi:hypothetical protein